VNYWDEKYAELEVKISQAQWDKDFAHLETDTLYHIIDRDRVIFLGNIL